MGWISSVVSDVVDTVKDAATEAVGKIAQVASGGFIGKLIADACAHLGLPPAICNIMAMIGDPSYTTKGLCDMIDEVGKKLGLPAELCGALKKIVHKAEEYAKAFATGGFGNVVAMMGKDLGLPPALCEALAAAIDSATGNAAGAAAHIAKLAMEAGKLLGVPDGLLDVAKLGTDLYSGNYSAAAGSAMSVGLHVVDQLDIPDELKTLAHMGVDAYKGDNAALQADSLKLAADVGERLGLPPEAMGLLKMVIAYEQGDTEAMKEAGKELAKDVVNRLPEQARGLLNQAIDFVAKDPAKALEMVKNLPAEAQAAFTMLTNAIKDPKLLGKLADEGIKFLPKEIQGPVHEAVTLYLKDPAKALELIKNLPAEGQAAVKKLLDQATDPEALKQGAKVLIDEAKSRLSPEAQRALTVATHLGGGNIEALKEDLKSFTEDEIKKLPPEARKTLNLVGNIANGDTGALKKEFDRVKNEAQRELLDMYAIPVRG